MNIQEVKEHLNGLKTMSELNPKDYALEGKIADAIASQKGDMKFTQLRKFFGHIKKIESTMVKGKKDEDPIDGADIYLLIPELAYGVGRNVISKDFYDIMKICLGGDKIKNVKDFKRFVDLLSAVIAFHKMRS